ncbi:DUF1566 domain-containing protein [Treponema bryantii]|uniref:Lcl domain-containing protein n=1 Tax=Treponema bryantii TaxID=163 RepID=UPI0003B45436|nr:DUF1566 domain-containing protein [Treponema bryantii]
MKYFKCLLSLSFMVVLFCTACSQSSSDATDAPDATYTVTYVDGVDGAEIAVPSDTNRYKAGDSVTVKFTDSGNREYYTFAGWSDGSTTYTSSGTTTFTMGSANVTLTAQWQWNNSFIGTKANSEQKEVGDIVFNDGSAMPYTTFTSLDTSAKNEKKAKAIALIFYRGTGLNSDILTNYETATWTTNTSTTSRTLGVGLKHNKSGLAWCTNDAYLYNHDIITIQCNPNENTGSYTFTRDKNGSDNRLDVFSWEGNREKYPAFCFSQPYATTTVTNIPADSGFAGGWYLPSIAELYQIYACRSDTTNGFDIDAASEALGGDKFENSLYWSSSQDSSFLTRSWILNFSTGRVAETNKDQGNCICCIRAFD